MLHTRCNSILHELLLSFPMLILLFSIFLFRLCESVYYFAGWNSIPEEGGTYERRDAKYAQHPYCGVKENTVSWILKIFVHFLSNFFNFCWLESSIWSTLIKILKFLNTFCIWNLIFLSNRKAVIIWRRTESTVSDSAGKTFPSYSCCRIEIENSKILNLLKVLSSAKVYHARCLNF